MSRLSVAFLIGIAAFASDDPWAKVKELKSGTELRIYKHGSVQPVTAAMDELTPERLLVIVNKKEQIAIARDQIDRIDFRPQGSRVKKVTTNKEVNPPYQHTSANAPIEKPPIPGSSTETNVTLGSKPEFETVYRRPPK